VKLGWLALLAATSLVGRVARSTAETASPERLRGLDPTDLSHTYAIGAFTPEYEPPAAGTYSLPIIRTVGDHPVLDVDGRSTSLYALQGERTALVAFVYTTCAEVAGCPLSQAVMQRVDRVLAEDAELARQVVLITVSFDPERDTPARMKSVRGFYEPRTDWWFVTTRDPAELDPILADFDQPIAKLRFEDGHWSGIFRHVLKVFLVDRQHHVRNIYSAGFLNPSLVLNDLRTIVMGENGWQASSSRTAGPPSR
jgi:cytochrome c peroxidase